ncbi:SPOR domain-containing protein [Massilia sp. W12]|uniref:SPOR domain-containing protein n=1 Tax=Massilia sp. W12 TaxID=3126507 RepID=UPI0030D52C13
MLKFTFATLLLLNAGLFAWHQGYLRDVLPSEREPARVRNQLQAQQLRVLSAAQVQSMQNALGPGGEGLSSAAASAASAVSAPAAASPSPTPTPTPTPTPALVKAEPVACVEIGNFMLGDARRFETQLASLKLGERQTRINVQESGKYMVYIPSQGSREKTDEKIKQLETRGIKKTEYFIFPETSPLKWSISLGAFSSEEAAKKHLEKLTEKHDVRTAKVGPYPGSSATTRVAYQLRNIDSEIKAKVEKMRQGFANQEMRACVNRPAAG